MGAAADGTRTHRYCRSSQPLSEGLLSSRNSKYRYARLSGPRTIRLVRVHPKIPSEPFACSFKYVSLDEKPSYKAISYAWGEDVPCQRVTLDGRGQMVINDALASVLARLADSGQYGWFWIDKLCINQADHREKSAQVQMMMDIFASAEQVWAWLGPAGDDSELAIAFVPILARAFKRLEEEDLPVNMEHLKAIPACARDSAFWPALRKLLKRRWFTRAWIVQEVAVAKKITLYCGEDDLSLDSLTYVLEVDFVTGLHQLTWNKSSNFSDKPDELDILLLSQMQSRCAMRELPRLSTNMIFCRAFGASNERDHIYAFLGISDGRRDLALKPDYQKSVEAVYIDVARYLLLQQSLNIGRRYRDWETRTFQLQVTHCPLIHAAGIGWPRKLSTLPSWVPDWTSNKRAFLGALEEIGEYEACLKFNFDVSVGTDPTSIVLKGRNIDAVERIYSLHQTSYHSVLSSEVVRIPKSPLEWVPGGIAALQMRDPYFCNGFEENRASVVSNVLTGNLLCHRAILDWATGKAEVDIANDFESYRKAAAHAAGIGDTGSWTEIHYKRAHFVRIVMAMIEDRVLFSTQTGLLGIGPPLMQPGDRVFLIHGACTPFVLRPHSPKQSWTSRFRKPAPWWNLVGDCYVHDLMRGEGVGLANAQNIIVL
ncbi:uncharacterized protein A1O5_05670 [Cladophialophora psammophila CBS 110553]|uniref:Heterokaryon incompatibility domain-containing protein n=1 Tax=Cladophialophora psammophila CBS 110553 TaxID=1182543 RepID=W9X025_9EURO|nr:uncharacterized protein A1O5_05670 [Cladophialophora psammophila CBS 110553]EXJ70680.1 hypothetical protein A1O5_05670 [Cladophialophora psammophila CBS 110553]